MPVALNENELGLSRPSPELGGDTVLRLRDMAGVGRAEIQTCDFDPECDPDRREATAEVQTVRMLQDVSDGKSTIQCVLVLYSESMGVLPQC